MSMEHHGGISTGEKPQQSYTVAKQVGLGKGNEEFGLQSIFVHPSK
jgi:hypothetical protein